MVLLVIEVTILGFGGWLGNVFQGQSSYLVNFGKTKILLDVGEGAYRSLIRCTDFNLEDIDYIIITHAHGDHTLGLPTMLQMAAYKRVKLTIVAPEDAVKGIKELLQAVRAPSLLDNIEFIQIPYSGSFQLKSLKVITCRSLHTVPGVSLVIKYYSSKVSYSGDTAINESFLKAAEGSDLLIHEISVPKEMEKEAERYGHTSALRINEILSIAKPRFLLPVHFHMIPPVLEVSKLQSSTKVLIPMVCGTYQI